MAFEETFGERLRRSRERSGLSQQEAADTLGVAREVISYWEHERRTPNRLQLERLAVEYRTTVGYLIGREPTPSWAEERAPLYRGLYARPVRVRDEVEQWLHFLDRWADLLILHGRQSSGRGWPPRDLMKAAQSVTDSRRAPALAARVRQHYHLGLDALSDLYTFLDEHGVVVCRAPLGGLSEPGDISGVYYNHPWLGACILVNADMTYGRQIFTLAHELAHALFHYSEHGLVSRAGDVDRKERFADAFAGHFLVPAPSLRALVDRDANGLVKDPFEVIRLQRYFRVSYATMLYRLRAEGFLEGQQYEEYQSYSPSYLAAQLGFDVREYQHPSTSTSMTLMMYPGSVVWQLRNMVAHGQLSVAEAASLLRVGTNAIETNFLRLPKKASQEERREFREMPRPPRPRTKADAGKPDRAMSGTLDDERTTARSDHS